MSSFFKLIHIFFYFYLFKDCDGKSLLYVSFDDPKATNKITKSSRFTFLTANMLLGPNFVGKFNNMSDVYKRLLGSAKVLSMEECKPTPENIQILENSSFDTEQKRNAVIIENMPENVDFVCLQEVWDKLSAMALIYKMRKHFPYFLTDVSQDLGNSNFLHRCKLFSSFIRIRSF